MNSRSVSDNLVNFSTDLASTLNQLDSKEPLLSFPFDHLYACSETVDRRQTLHLKEVEISTHCGVQHQDKHATQRVASLESQNKKLKDLLIYHLDLIQQQNELMSKREKAFQALRQENDALKSKVSRVGVERKVAYGHHGFISPPLHVPATITTTFRTDVPSSTTQQSIYQAFNEAMPSNDHYVSPNASHLIPLLYTPRRANEPLDPFGIDRPAAIDPSLMQDTLKTATMPSILEDQSFPSEAPVIENKRSKRDSKAVEDKNEPKYTVTTNSGHPKISRNRKRPTGIGSFSRMPKKANAPNKDKSNYDEGLLDANTQSKMAKLGHTFLQERFQLTEPTPTGEDPYQIGEAEMREQSPIPKLMFKKNNHGRIRVCTEIVGVTTTTTSTTPTRPIDDTMITTSSSRPKRQKMVDPYSASNVHIQSNQDAASPALEEEQELDVEKTDSDNDWRVFTMNKPRKTSLCDFSYGESSANLVNVPLDITKMSFPDLFEPGPVNAESSSVIEIETAPELQSTEKSKKRGARTSLAGPLDEETSAETKRAADTKRGRKRALSTAASIKRGDNTQPKVPAKPRARRATRAKKPPVPGMTTKKLYHTCVGDPDISWYLGLNPDVKKEDCEPTENTSSNVEVPRWREKPYTSLYSLEGTENLDDKVFEKRHQKLEAEERRQLRWHMRRIREQRHVERLKQRQRDPWATGATQPSRGEYTIWPQPVRDLQYIEITDTLPVTAFGADVPDLPEKNFGLPWMRISKALKRSKRSKTLH